MRESRIFGGSAEGKEPAQETEMKQLKMQALNQKYIGSQTLRNERLLGRKVRNSARNIEEV